MTAFSWESVQLWRCTVCGKWSHAKTQPRKHQRWVTEGQPGYDSSLVEAGAYDHINGFTDPGGHPLDCGPFTPFVASPGRLR